MGKSAEGGGGELAKGGGGDELTVRHAPRRQYWPQKRSV
jgi:hypothetical protein